jgi:hypothetical protein
VKSSKLRKAKAVIAEFCGDGGDCYAGCSGGLQAGTMAETYHSLSKTRTLIRNVFYVLLSFGAKSSRAWCCVWSGDEQCSACDG